MRSHDSHRVERVASVIKRSVALIIETELADPRIFGVSVVDVTVSRDLKFATVYVYIEGDDQSVLNALRNSAGYVRKIFAETNREMRVVPHFRFELDKSQSYYEHIDSLIKGLHNEGDNN
ncbi:MAG: 30S ribosome-binding factor RbfA [Clostridiales bacterium]|nr:30S ribosome-binding factor RbfA [Clostridiales bacterium]